MAYILNTNISGNKKCVYALSEIYGLGNKKTQQICDQLGFSAQIKYKNLNISQTDKLSRSISQKHNTGLNLKRMEKKNKSLFISINSYKGFRYTEGLPCRGQRTHGNAQTARKNSPFSRGKESRKKM